MSINNNDPKSLPEGTDNKGSFLSRIAAHYNFDEALYGESTEERIEKNEEILPRNMDEGDDNRSGRDHLDGK